MGQMENSLPEGRRGRKSGREGRGEVAFENEGELSQSVGGRGGGTRSRGEGRGGRGIHGNKPGLREIGLSEGEFVCNNNTNYFLSLRSLGCVGGRNGELKCEKLEG